MTTSGIAPCYPVNAKTIAEATPEHCYSKADYDLSTREAFEVPFTDKTLTCADCGQEFIFSAEDQEFYATRGFTEPKRCRSCRAVRRNEREGGGDAGGSFARAPRPERELFDVICSNCGQPTKVPFQPRGDRPVYCRDCFERMGGGAAGGGGMSRSAPPRR